MLLRRAPAFRARSRALAGEEPDRGEQDGLAGARLARDGVEPGAERDVGLLDDGESADRQLLDHGAMRGTETDGTETERCAKPASFAASMMSRTVSKGVSG